MIAALFFLAGVCLIVGGVSGLMQGRRKKLRPLPPEKMLWCGTDAAGLPILQHPDDERQ